MDSRKQLELALREWLRSHHGVIGRSEALQLGASDGQIRAKFRRGEWARVHRGVYRDTAAPRTHYQELRAACVSFAGRPVASHASAAWVWGLQRHPPAKPEVTVPTGFQPGRNGQGIAVHASIDLDRSRIVTRQAIPVTDPLRTLVDLGASVSAPGPDGLEAAVDSALAARLVTIEGLVAELSRLSRCGRPGPGPLRRLLAARGFIGVPHPSALESRTLRLFGRAGLPDPEVESWVGDDGEYRLDFAYSVIMFAVEVDGYVWHFTPEQLRRDHARRNELQRQGWVVLVYTWRDVVGDPSRVAAEIATTYHRLSGGGIATATRTRTSPAVSPRSSPFAGGR